MVIKWIWGGGVFSHYCIIWKIDFYLAQLIQTFGDLPIFLTKDIPLNITVNRILYTHYCRYSQFHHRCILVVYQSDKEIALLLLVLLAELRKSAERLYLPGNSSENQPWTQYSLKLKMSHYRKVFSFGSQRTNQLLGVTGKKQTNYLILLISVMFIIGNDLIERFAWLLEVQHTRI